MPRLDPLKIIKTIQNKIFEVRGERVMLDRDLADLYGVETKTINQAVKRNIKRFPEDFMFQLSFHELKNLRLQIATSSFEGIEYHTVAETEIQIPTADWGGNRYMPYAFTEQGIAMLSGVLKSEKAIAMNISIMRAFVELRRLLLMQHDLREQVKLIKERVGEHDTQLQHIYDALENLLDENAAQKKMAGTRTNRI